MINTIVTWQNNTPTPEEIDACLTQVQLMVSEGKTTGEHTVNQLETMYVVTRHWTDQAAAQEWIDFVTPYSPVSAVIEQP